MSSWTRCWHIAVEALWGVVDWKVVGDRYAEK